MTGHEMQRAFLALPDALVAPWLEEQLRLADEFDYEVPGLSDSAHHNAVVWLTDYLCDEPAEMFVVMRRLIQSAYSALRRLS